MKPSPEKIKLKLTTSGFNNVRNAIYKAMMLKQNYDNDPVDQFAKIMSIGQYEIIKKIWLKATIKIDSLDHTRPDINLTLKRVEYSAFYCIFLTTGAILTTSEQITINEITQKIDQLC